MLKNIKDYIYDLEFKINIYNNKINIINFKEIKLLEENEVIILTDKKIITVKGSNLVLNKCLEKEILLSGLIKEIKFNDI